MAKTITLSFPHELTEAEVKRRIIAGIADARAKHPSALQSSTEKWEGNQLSVSARAMGQTIAARVKINPTTVDVAVDLPFMLAMFAGKFKPQIEAEARKLLTK